MNHNEDEEEFDYLFKIILSGDSGVGKSNMLLRYVKNVFGKTNPTIGVEFAVKTITLGNKVRIKAQIWDTSGCERYRSITIGHYRKSVGALLVYDITNEESFNNLGYWLQAIREHADPSIVIALVANKCDIMFSDPSKREVMKEAAVHFAKENELIFYEESSALADINVKQIVELLLQKIYEKQMNLIKEGKKAPDSLKLAFEEETEKPSGKCC